MLIAYYSWAGKGQSFSDVSFFFCSDWNRWKYLMVSLFIKSLAYFFPGNNLVQKYQNYTIGWLDFFQMTLSILFWKTNVLRRWRPVNWFDNRKWFQSFRNFYSALLLLIALDTLRTYQRWLIYTLTGFTNIH